jgi:glycosyltransferase involved in cell wall biosynthesis
LEIGFEKNMLETVAHVMAHSNIIARELQDNYQFDPRKLVTFFPPIDTDTFSPVTPEEVIKTVQRFDISKKKLTFLFPSCGHQCKGLQPLVTAFSRLDPDKFELLVAGDPIPGKHPANIHHIGYVQNLAPLYTSVDFTILPSHYEAFGLVIPESLQCQTPVITTEAVGAAELLSGDDGIIMKDNLPETIMKTVTNLVGRQFTVSPNFAEKHRLTIEQHIADIKSLVPLS